VHLANRLGESLPPSTRIILHYLGGKIDAELLFDAQIDFNSLRGKCAAVISNDPYFRSIRLYQEDAPN
jgi:hypothetical protein